MSYDRFMTHLECSVLSDVQLTECLLWRSYRNAGDRWGSDHPKALNLKDLSEAARLKGRAMRLRARGRVASAMRCENHANYMASSAFNRRARCRGL